MACQATHMWTLNGLVAAFLDLIVAYFLLCASAIFFFASKFVGLVGLKLPCPCDGMIFNNPSKDHCLNRILVDFPARKVSNVQLSLKNKFPFKESVWARNYDRDIDEDNCLNEILEIEGDASCSSMSNSERQLNVVKKEFVTGNEKRDMKGKSRLHWRRRGASDHGNYSSVSSCDPSLHEEIFGGIHHSLSSSCNDGNENEEGSSLILGYGDEARDNKKPFSVVERRRNVQNSVQVNNLNEGTGTKKNVMFVEELQEEIHFSGEYKNAIRLLEQSLNEERSARNALHIELEKERSAAASAADEAMAMISRLQEEKASVELEARQYQRITEAKAAYDAEEMIILKEILVRREMEKLFLEKEIEAYRLMISPGNQLLEDDSSDRSDAQQQPLAFSVDLTDDPMTMLRQLSASIDEKVMKQQMCANGAMNESSSMHYNDKKYSFQKQEKLGGESRQISGCTSDGNLNLQETGASTDLHSLPKGIQEFSVLDTSIPIEQNELDKVEEINFGNTLLDEKNVLTFNGTKTSDLRDTESLKQHVPCEFSSSPDREYEKDSLVCDVHVVGDGESLGNVENISKSELLSVDHSYEAGVKTSALFESPVMDSVLISTDYPCTNDIHVEVDVKESSSIKDQGFPPLDPKSRSYDLQRSSSFVTSHGLPPVGQKSRSSDLRRSSIAVMDCDRLKIDNEIEQLHERLRIIQEGREKLFFSTTSHDSKNSQLKLIEDIAHPVQKICHVKGRGAAVRQVSLPLPTSKAFSKKKRYGSISSAFKRNS